MDIRFQLLNKYESGQHIPPAKTLIRLAQALETFNEEDRITIIKVIDAMIAKHRMEAALTPMEKQAASS